MLLYMNWFPTVSGCCYYWPYPALSFFLKINFLWPMIAAISSLKEQVEGIQELDQSVEILIRLLCAVPGWSEKNVQVLAAIRFGSK